jgi:hypothetical protein
MIAGSEPFADPCAVNRESAHLTPRSVAYRRDHSDFIRVALGPSRNRGQGALCCTAAVRQWPCPSAYYLNPMTHHRETLRRQVKASARSYGFRNRYQPISISCLNCFALHAARGSRAEPVDTGPRLCIESERSPHAENIATTQTPATLSQAILRPLAPAVRSSVRGPGSQAIIALKSDAGGLPRIPGAAERHSEWELLTSAGPREIVKTHELRLETYWDI